MGEASKGGLEGSGGQTGSQEGSGRQVGSTGGGDRGHVESMERFGGAGGVCRGFDGVQEAHRVHKGHR